MVFEKCIIRENSVNVFKDTVLQTDSQTCHRDTQKKSSDISLRSTMTSQLVSPLT